MRAPAEILQDVVEQAGRLVKADGVILDLLDPASGNLEWALDDGVLSQDETTETPILSDDFDRIDADGDGLISRDEFTAAQR